MARYYDTRPSDCKGWMYSKSYRLYFYKWETLFELHNIYDYYDIAEKDYERVKNMCLKDLEVVDAETMQPLWKE